jgi:hypothetical protein
MSTSASPSSAATPRACGAQRVDEKERVLLDEQKINQLFRDVWRCHRAGAMVGR